MLGDGGVLEGVYEGGEEEDIYVILSRIKIFIKMLKGKTMYLRKFQEVLKILLTLGFPRRVF